VYDVPESDDELSTPIVGNIESATASRKQASANGSTSERRGRSVKGVESESAKLSRDELGSSLPNDSAPSPAGSKQQRRSSKATENETLDATEQRIAPGTINGSATKGRRRPIKATETQTSEPVDKEPAPTAKPTKPAKPAKKPSIWEIRRALTRGLPIDAALAAYAAPVPDENEPRTSNPDSTPSGRKRHLDKEPGGETPPLKGILTPSRRDGTPRTRKSVAFDSGGDKGREVFFEDLPSKSTAKKAVKSPKELPKTVTAGLSEPDSAVDDDAEMQDREDEDEEIDEEIDEEVCSICKKPDSKPPNEILFCDGCDMAFHQRCYDVPTIPVGDWLCRNCTQDGDMIIPKDGSSKISALSGQKTEQAPGIPNFEQHLRAVTRVLIDRCTGRRVLPLQGQDEAYEKAFQLVEQTVLAGEGNSMLVIGARGSGKTTVCFWRRSVASWLANR
jgi:origin recognition complex subunit 4